LVWGVASLLVVGSQTVKGAYPLLLREI